MPRIPIFSNLESRDGTLAKGPLLKNGYYEKRGEDESIAIKRPGLTLTTSLGSGAGQGLTAFRDADGIERLYAVQNGVAVLGDVTGTSGVWAQNSVSFNGGSGERHAFASFQGKIWAVGGKSAYNKSTINGSTWTTAATNIFSSVDSSFRWQGKLVVLNSALYFIAPRLDGGSAGTKEVWRSFDGLTWVRLTAAAAFPQTYAAQVQVLDGKIFYLGATNGTGAPTDDVYSTSDGVTWTLVTATPGFSDPTIRTEFASTTFNGLLWVAAGRIGGANVNSVYSSPDGATWTLATAAAAFTASRFPVLIGYSGAMLYAYKDVGSGIDQIYTTLDGITWTSVSHSGLTSDWATSNHSIHGIYFNGGIAIYPGGGVIEVYPTATTTGAVTIATVGASDMFDFQQDYSGSQIMIRGATTAYKLTTATSALTQVTDADYPVQTVRGNPYLNGRFYVMEPDGTIWNSADEDCTSWAATDFVSCEFEPDGGVALVKYDAYIVAMGRYTIETFYAGNTGAGSPLLPVTTGVFLVGCAHANAVAQFESSVIFMGQRKGQGSTFQKGRFIGKLQGQSYQTISSPDVERVLNADDLATVYSAVVSIAGHTFYLLTLGTSALTLAYDTVTQTWGQWSFRTIGAAQSVTTLTQTAGLATATKTAHGYSDGDRITIAGANQAGYNSTFVVNVTSSSTFTFPVDSGTVSPATGTITATGYTDGYFPIVASCNYQGAQVFQAVSGGNVYEIAETATDDNGAYIDYVHRLGKIDSKNNKPKFMSGLEIIGDKVSANAYVRYTDDDYQTYSYYRKVDLSLKRSRLARLGSYRRRAIVVRHTDSARFRVEALECDIEQGR